MEQIAGPDKAQTDPPGDLLVSILSELTSASERQTDAIGSLARLIASQERAESIAAVAAAKAATAAADAAKIADQAAQAAQAAVRVFADEQGNRRSAERLALHEMKNMHQSISLLVGAVQGALKRIGPLELEVDQQRELRLALEIDQNRTMAREKSDREQ